MSKSEKQPQTAAAAPVTEQATSLWDNIKVAARDDRPEIATWTKQLVDDALAGTISYDKNLTRSIKSRVAAVDAEISRQLAAIMHDPRFQRLESSWRGLHHLVQQSETATDLKINVLQVSKDELAKDLENAVEFDQSQAFKKIYTAEFDMPGGVPLGAVIGDYEFENHPQDIQLLTEISKVAAAAFCPFIAAASPKLFDLESFTDLPEPRDLEMIFDSPEYVQWRAFRETEESRFVVLTLPRVLSRLPYGKHTKKVDAFEFEEVELGDDGKPKTVPHDQYCWMNAAYVLGTRLTDSFARTAWCTSIRGAENGGKVQGLPVHVVKSEDGDSTIKCPTEVGISGRRSAELDKLGFLSLGHFKDKDYAVFFGAQTTQKPKKYDKDDATENAALSARLPYIMATSRIAHFLKVIARDKIGSFMEQSDCQKWLQNWIADYICGDPNASPAEKAKRPLADAKIEVEAVPGNPGAYNAVCYLRPWLQIEELTASLRLVAQIPSGKDK